MEQLETRQVLSADNLAIVPFWDGETSGPSSTLTNRVGGNPITGNGASIFFESAVVQSGRGAYRINTNGAIPTGGFQFVGTALTGFFGEYADSRDVTNFSEVRFWLKNEIASAFRLVFEFKDERNSNAHRARFAFNVSATTSWTEYVVPLDFAAPGWTITGTPDLSRARLFLLVMEASSGPVNGQIYLDQMTLTERGGALNPQTAPFESIVDRVAERQFRGLWGSRDRASGLVPDISSFADVMALNSTSGLLQVLPAAIERGWITQSQANNYVSQLLDTLHTVLDQVSATGNGGFLPPRYIDRVQLTPTKNLEESPVDAAFLALALRQYKSEPATPAALRSNIDTLLDRFNFSAFSAANGWRQAYQYPTSSFTPGTYDGYSTEIYVMSLAAHLARTHRVDIAAHWNSGTIRTLDSLVDSAEAHLVHGQNDYRAPFVQWLFHMFADVSERGDDTFPDPELRRNPYWNAVLYQREAFRKLDELNRPIFTQPDAGDDGTGATYQAFSLYEDFGQPALFMPWSTIFGLHAELPDAEDALRELLSHDFHSPLGISDSAVWQTGAADYTRLTARHDFWNLALSTMALTNYLTGTNSDFAQVPEVSSALDRVLPPRSLELPVPQSLVTHRNWVTFTPTNYNPGLGIQPSEAQIEANLRRLYDHGWRGLIHYTMDGTLREVPRIAKQVGFDKVIAGVFWFDAAQLERERLALSQELAENPDYIDAIVVGNECIHRGVCTYETLVEEVGKFKTTSNKPVTTTEVGFRYLDDHRLLDVGDWVFPNIQPFCAPVLDVEDAVQHFSNEFQAIRNIARQRIPGRIVSTKEVWWPSDGHPQGTEANQAEFFRLLYETPTFFAWGESFDQTWKSDGECFGAGPHWGLYEEDARWKSIIPQLHTYYTDLYGVDRGPQDLAGRHPAGGWYVGNSDGEKFTTTKWTSWATVEWTDVAAGDVNGDGRTDIVGRHPNGGWYVARSTGGGFVNEKWTSWATVEWDDVQLGDFNGDGRADIAGRHPNGGWYVARSTGTQFINEKWTSWATVDWSDVKVGDFNGDGLDDIVGRHPNGGWYVARSTGVGFVNTKWTSWAVVDWADVRVGDFNGDGRDDVVGRHPNGAWYVARSTGSNFVNEKWGSWALVGWTDVLLGDFNGDGRSDLLGRHPNGSWYVARSTGAKFDSTKWDHWALVGWAGIRVGDFDGDGRSDIAGRHPNGRWYVAKSTGSSFISEIWASWATVAWTDILVGDFTDF